MFDRHSSRDLAIPTFLFGALTIFALLLAPAESALGQRPLIAIERTDQTLIGSYENIDISYEANGSALVIGGFDILIAYDATILSFINATPGPLLTDCGWEYFTYRFGAVGNCAGSAPTGLVRVVALAEDASLPGSPTCLIGQSGAGVLATLQFLVTNDYSYECESTPLQFYWCDCGDNAVASSQGDTLLVADTVYWGTSSAEFYPVPAGLFTSAGLPDECIDEIQGTFEPIRAVNFREGLIEFACANFVPQCGDFNSDGSQNISDAVYGVRYVFAGGPPPLDVAGGDVNCDGFTSIADIVYLVTYIFAGGPAPCADCP